MDSPRRSQGLQKDYGNLAHLGHVCPSSYKKAHMTQTSPPFALFIRGPSDIIFALSDVLGFEMDMQALAVSVFEDGPNTMHVQALFATKTEAQSCQSTLNLDGLEHFITQLPDEDWTAKSQLGLPPVEAGRFFIHGAHDRDKIPMHTPYPIQIDAGIAFGTGHHGTTKGCLLALEDLIRQPPSKVKKTLENYPKRVLDLGCGSGVLAIAIVKAMNIDVLASDIDQDAVDVTLHNAKINGVGGQITAVQADGLPDNTKYNLIFANILAGPLVGLAPNIATALAKGGHVILSGLLDEQAHTLIKAYETQHLTLVRSASLAGWTTLTMRRT